MACGASGVPGLLVDAQRLGLPDRHHSRSHLLRAVVELEVEVGLAGPAQLVIRWDDLLGREEAEVELVEVGLDLRWLDDVLRVRLGVLLDGDVLVTRADHVHAQLEVGGDVCEALAVWVAHDDPLVQEGVLRLQVDEV